MAYARDAVTRELRAPREAMAGDEPREKAAADP